MDLKKVNKIVKLAKKNYSQKSDKYNQYLENTQQFISLNSLVGKKHNLSNNKSRLNTSQNSLSNSSQDDNFIQDLNSNSNLNELNDNLSSLNSNVSSLNSNINSSPFQSPQMQHINPNAENSMKEFESHQMPIQSQPFMHQPMGSPVNVVGGDGSGTPINIVAKNYINPDSFEDDDDLVEDLSKKETKSHQLAKLPNNLIQSSSTDWEPINYRGVDESYHLWKLAKVEVKFDEEHQKLLYKILEPELTQDEVKVLEELKKGFIYVFEKIMHDSKSMSEAELIGKGTKKLCSKYGIKLSSEQLEKIIYYLERDFLGLDIIEPIMYDKYIEDISCDGLGVPIFVNHLKYGPLEVNRKYTDGLKLNSFIIKLAQKSNQEVSLSKPILQGALPDGSRVEAIYGKEVSEKGSSFTIRKFRAEPFTPVHLIEFGTMPPFMLAYLWLAVENKQSILVSGGTATGKTTILNALSLFVPPTSKIVSIEDTPEINLPHEHWLPLIARETEGKSQVSMFDLLKASLRERPDYIIVGEIRGKEAAILFQGMATGHAGLGTVHAEKFVDLVNRMTIEPINLPKQLITELNLCIFMNRVKVKENVVRRAVSIVEVVDYDSRKDKFLSNEFVNYKPLEDTFDFNEKSFVISHLLQLRGGKEDALWHEIEKRRRILDLMHKSGLTEFQDVSSVIKAYYKDPAGIFDYVEKYKSTIKKEENGTAKKNN